MQPIVGRLTVPEIKALAMEIAAEGQPFRLAKVQRRAAYQAKDGRLLCAVGYCAGGQALDELHREGKLALVAGYSVAAILAMSSGPSSVSQPHFGCSEQRTVGKSVAGKWHFGQKAIHSPPVRFPRLNSTV